MVGFKNGHIHKNLTQNVEPKRYIAGNAEEEEEEEIHRRGFVVEIMPIRLTG